MASDTAATTAVVERTDNVDRAAVVVVVSKCDEEVVGSDMAVVV